MLTQQAFNALLKTLEEPPAHVIFIFATTEPHKVLPTILSRCQRFDLRRIPALTIAKHLAYIAAKEGVDLTEDAAAAIAIAAEGGLRDAESMLDQLVAFCGNSVGEKEVLEVFGLTSEHIVADLTRAILNQSAAVALAIVHQQSEAGKDLAKLLGDLLAFFRNLLIYKIDPQSLREEISDQARVSLQEMVDVVDTQRLLRLIEEISEVEADDQVGVEQEASLGNRSDPSDPHAQRGQSGKCGGCPGKSAWSFAFTRRARRQRLYPLASSPRQRKPVQSPPRSERNHRNVSACSIERRRDSETGRAARSEKRNSTRAERIVGIGVGASSSGSPQPEALDHFVDRAGHPACLGKWNTEPRISEEPFARGRLVNAAKQPEISRGGGWSGTRRLMETRVRIARRPVCCRNEIGAIAADRSDGRL